MSLFSSTQSLVSQTPLDSSVDKSSALHLLQDFNAFPLLQPQVIRNQIIAAPPAGEWLVKEATTVATSGVVPEYRAVTASVPFGPLGKSSVITRSAYVRTEDGMVAVFQAPLGLRGRNVWRVVVGDGGGLVLREEATLTGPFLLMPFIVMTERKSHAEHGLSFARKLAEMAA